MVGEGLSVGALVVVEDIFEDETVVGLVALSFVSVTMQYEAHSYHGSRYMLIDGF
jgi:hypothetical protein